MVYQFDSVIINFINSSRSRSRSQRRYSRSPRNNRNRSPRNFRQKETRRDDPSPKRPDRFDRNEKPIRPADNRREREPEVVRITEKPREKARTYTDDKEPIKKVEDKSSKKNGNDGEKEGKPKPPPRTSNGADYEKKREYQVKITEQKISFKETVRGKQPEARETKISISSSSTPSRTPSPFLKPHERKDYAKPPTAEAPPKVTPKVIVKETIGVNSSSEEKTAKINRKRRSSSASSLDVEVLKTSRKVEVLKKDSRKAEKVEITTRKKEIGDSESRKKPAHDGSDMESVTSEKSKKRKKRNRDGSASEESEKKKKHKLKKHKKSSKKSKKKERSVSKEKSSASEAESKVNEYLEKKLREKALVSLRLKNKNVQ